jgi:hypothetical protein
MQTAEERRKALVRRSTVRQALGLGLVIIGLVLGTVGAVL